MIMLEYNARNVAPNVSLVELDGDNVHEEKRSPADRPTRFRRSAYKIELNEERKPGGQTGKLQAI